MKIGSHQLAPVQAIAGAIACSIDWHLRQAGAGGARKGGAARPSGAATGRYAGEGGGGGGGGAGRSPARAAVPGQPAAHDKYSFNAFRGGGP